MTKQTIKEISREIFNQGYEQSANALAQLTGKKVAMLKQEIVFTRPEDLLKKVASKQELTILVTDVIGDAKGTSFLILNAYEASKLLELMLAKLKSFQDNDFYQDIILKEIDNVLAAAVITQLSNFLGLKIYGEVPAIIRPPGEAHEWLKTQLGKVRNISDMLSTVSFVFEDDLKLSPAFVWVLDEDFSSMLNQKAFSNENERNHENSKLS